MVTFKFDASNLDEEIQDRVNDLLTRIAADLSNYLGDEVPVGATGNLRNSVQILRFSEDNSSVTVAVRADYANLVRLGRDPGTFPEFEPLKKWVDRVIGAEQYSTWGGDGWEINSLDQATYLVGKSIEETGTSENRYVERSLERLKQKYS